MRTRIVVVVSAVLGVLILIPVVTVIGLGAYGSSLGGSTTSVGTRGAELKLIPAHGVPGTAVRVEGRNWPARARITVSLSRPSTSEGGEPLRMRLQNLIASRNGTFRMDTVIPAALANPDTRGFLITAEALDRNENPVADVSAGFDIEPYPNSVVVKTVDAETGQPLADSVLEISDAFGRIVTDAITGPTGSAVFSGLTPGSLTVTVRRLGYMEGKGSIGVNQEGVSEQTLALTRAPIRRMYVPAAMSANGELATLTGIDRWTGLRFQHEVSIPPDRRLPTIGENRRVFFGHLLPVDIDVVPAATVREVTTPRQLLAIGRALTAAEPDVSAFPTSIALRHIGQTDKGDVIHSFAASGLISFVSRIFIVDPRSGDLVFNESISSAEIPVFPPGQQLVHLIHRFTGVIRTVDLSTGDIVKLTERVPPPIVQAISLAPDGINAFLLKADGTLHDFNLENLSVGPVLSTNPGSTMMARGPEGKVYLVNPLQSEIVVLDATGSRWETSIQLPGRTSWAWIDPEGPFIFAGSYEDGNLTIHLVEKDTLAYRTSHTFPTAISAGVSRRSRSNLENETVIGRGSAT